MERKPDAEIDSDIETDTNEEIFLDKGIPKESAFLPGEGSVRVEVPLWLESDDRRRSRFRFPGVVSLSTSGCRFDISFSNSLK